ncbi:MAG: hypothetical protein ABT20_03045 [Rubrivivax sp. SCN 70-15]|nr:MAG: hypothetical protein ABT20_03045 [Rubrivivax sp. SCN 70-15]
MKTRFNLIAIALLAGAVTMPAFATTGTTIVGGEAGFQTHAMPTVKTRAQVQQELAAWRANPVSADGWRDVGGEAGAVYVGTGASGKSRAEVTGEMLQARRNPVGSDGWMNVGGEAGALFVGIPESRTDATRMAGPDGQPCHRRVGGLSRSGHMASSGARTC